MASIAMSNSERPRLRENGVCPMPTIAALSPIAFIATSPSAEGEGHADEAVQEEVVLRAVAALGELAVEVRAQLAHVLHRLGRRSGIRSGDDRVGPPFERLAILGR